MEHVIYDVRKKGTVVTDQQNRLVGVFQIVLEPSCGLEVEVIRRLIEQKDVSRAHQLSCEPESPAFAAAQLLQRLRARLFGIEPKTLKHSIYPRSKRVASLAIESFEIAVVPRQHLRRGSLSDLCELAALLRQRVFEGEKVREFTGSSFPDGSRATEIAELLEQCHSQAGLLRDDAFGWFLHSGDHFEERRLSASVAAEDCPTVTLADRERYTFEYSRSAKLHTSVRN
jgi:hypothetical protein